MVNLIYNCNHCYFQFKSHTHTHTHTHSDSERQQPPFTLATFVCYFKYGGKGSGSGLVAELVDTVLHVQTVGAFVQRAVRASYV